MKVKDLRDRLNQITDEERLNAELEISILDLHTQIAGLKVDTTALVIDSDLRNFQFNEFIAEDKVVSITISIIPKSGTAILYTDKRSASYQVKVLSNNSDLETVTISYDESIDKLKQHFKMIETMSSVGAD